MPWTAVTHIQNSQMHTYMVKIMRRHVPNVTHTLGTSREWLPTRTRLYSYPPGHTPLWPIKSHTCCDFHVLFLPSNLLLEYTETPCAAKRSFAYTPLQNSFPILRWRIFLYEDAWRVHTQTGHPIGRLHQQAPFGVLTGVAVVSSHLLGLGCAFSSASRVFLIWAIPSGTVFSLSFPVWMLVLTTPRILLASPMSLWTVSQILFCWFWRVWMSHTVFETFESSALKVHSSLDISEFFIRAKAERTMQDKKTRARRTYSIITLLCNQGGTWAVSRDGLNLACFGGVDWLGLGWSLFLKAKVIFS